MKVTLCAVGALILLSSITSIFNNLVVVDVSASKTDKMAEYSPDRNEQTENNYNYEETTRDDNRYNGYKNSDHSLTINKVLMNIQVMITINHHLIMEMHLIQVIIINHLIIEMRINRVMITINHHLIMEMRINQVITMMVMVLKTHTTWMTNTVNILQKNTKNLHALIQD